MAHDDWVKLSYAENSLLPLVGEIIMLRYSLQNVNFPFRPAAHFMQSSSHSVGPSTVNTNASQTRPNYHHVLVRGVSRGQHDRIVLKIFPLASYKHKPSGYANPTWNAVRWMSEEATDIQRSHHLPVPTIDWTPPSVPSAPILAFGNWKNNRPAWMLMVSATYVITNTTKWLRHRDNPIRLDLEVAATLQHYFDYQLPSMIPDTPLPSVPPFTANTLIIETVQIPEYYHVWAGMTHDHAASVCSKSTTKSEIERALNGDYELDPVSFWRNVTLPKKLQEGTEQPENLVGKISRWQNKCVAEGIEELDIEKDDQVKSEASLVDVLEDVYVQEVRFGGEECDENIQGDCADILK